MAKQEAPKDINCIINGTAMEIATNLLKDFYEKYPEAWINIHGSQGYFPIGWRRFGEYGLMKTRQRGLRDGR